MAATRCYIDFAAGDEARYMEELERYRSLSTWLEKNAGKYGLSTQLGDLDDSGRETLSAVYEAETKISLSPTSFTPPHSLLLPRLAINVSSSTGLRKTTTNFLDLLTDSKKLKSKRAPNPPLRYEGCKVFRIEDGFVAQTGDVTRQDGSGGESIYGGTFNDEKEGLKTPFELGTIAMANSGKNSNTSQFFVTLTSDPSRLKKLTGRYVAFARADTSDPDTRACLDRLGALADGKGGTRVPVWIAKCGTCD
ncbi:hypothetical protein JCM10212_004754 [Sporobolomyces blumeae]